MLVLRLAAMPPRRDLAGGGAGQPWYICAEITHTQGAAEFALLSFLTLAVRAKKELPMPLEVILPTNRWNKYKLYTGLYYSSQTLKELARSAGFGFVFDTHGNQEAFSKKMDNFCSSGNFDIRIGVAASSRLRAAAAPTVAPNYTLLHSHRLGLTEYYGQVWDYLRAVHERNRDRRPGLRVLLSIHQFWVGPLGHAASIYPEEARQVVRTLQFAPGFDPNTARHRNGALLAGPSEAAVGCAYVFFQTEMLCTPHKPKTNTSADWDCATPALRRQARQTVQLARGAGLACAIVNAITQPPAAVVAFPRLFFEEDATFQVVHVKKVLSRNPSFQDAIDQSHQNLRERYLALAAPLFITTAGTHWSDGILYKRSSMGAPSAVLADGRAGGQRGLPSAPELFECERDSQRCYDDCIFHRSVCFNRTTMAAAREDFGDAILVAPHGGQRRIAIEEAADGAFQGPPLGGGKA